MDPAVQTLLERLEHLSDQFRELRDGIRKAVNIASEDPEMALTRARKVLEYVVRDIYQRRINEPPGTRPLENLLQRLVKDGYFPDRLDAYATTVRKLGNVGTHMFAENVAITDVYRSLAQLMPILEWYFEVERPEAWDGGVQTTTIPPAQAKPTEPAPAPAAISVVPKGLRSFDVRDADFFIDLLPGPRDKDGLPESIRFWKHLVESDDEQAFAVGVIYGPSGCGKSSFVKAGLLPKLSSDVVTLYLEATADDTETRLLQGLRKRFPELPADQGIADTLATLRNRGGQKLLIVIDQFEQWLHSHRNEQHTELARALRQCDGDHIQCIVLVRDDFWLALQRFMTELDIEVVQGRNMAVIDLFDPIHARKVLAAFGRAYGRLQESTSKDQDLFLTRAIEGLSQDGRVICVQLALFAEMVKGKPWTPATLRELGGMEGVGVSFLEETFSRAASPQHHLHEKAARGVLKALLPEVGSDIKGNMRSCDELLDASGYANRAKDFDDLIRILDSELRLITPTDPEGKSTSAPARSNQPFYELTHDYLVPSLREWLTRKQKETRRGRAELRLAERSALWSARPQNRHLPSLWEYVNIRALTKRRNQTQAQQEMMKRAGRFHGLRTGIALSIVIGVTLAGVEFFGRSRAAFLVEQLVSADISEVPAIVEQLDGCRRWADPLLRHENATIAPDSPRKLHLRLALLPVDQRQIAPLREQLGLVTPAQFPVVRDALLPHKDVVVEPLWKFVFADGVPPQQRFQAACALATYAPEDERWKTIRKFVARTLVNCDATELLWWREALRPVRAQLLPSLAQAYEDSLDRVRSATQAGPMPLGPSGVAYPLSASSVPPGTASLPQTPAEDIYDDQARSFPIIWSASDVPAGRGGPPESPPPKQSRIFASETLADYFGDQPEVLFDFLAGAEPFQFPVVFDKFAADKPHAIPLCRQELERQLDEKATETERETLAGRQANAAIALYRMGDHEALWPQLKASPDPRVRSYLIHRLGPLGGDPRSLIERLAVEPDVTIRRALILTLGAFYAEQLPPDQRQPLFDKLCAIYEDEPDAGVHAAAEWLLRRWGQGHRLQSVNERLRSNEEQLRARRATDDKKWYVNTQGQTFVTVEPCEFLMGSIASERGHLPNEAQHRQEIQNRYAISAHEVTRAQYRRFAQAQRDTNEDNPYSCTNDSPQNNLTWYEAAHYCNWLSEREGVPRDDWFYVPNENGDYGPGMKTNERGLTARGYRLPTEAEWECACRAGAITSRYLGNSDELLSQYAWHQTNSHDKTWPVGSLTPNDFGLFDALGNTWEWCQDRYSETYAQMSNSESIDDDAVRVLRGGAFFDPPVIVRPARRYLNEPGFRNVSFGFRPARTMSLQD